MSACRLLMRIPSIEPIHKPTDMQHTHTHTYIYIYIYIIYVYTHRLIHNLYNTHRHTNTFVLSALDVDLLETIFIYVIHTIHTFSLILFQALSIPILKIF